jgi:hypothetical protein
MPFCTAFMSGLQPSISWDEVTQGYALGWYIVAPLALTWATAVREGLVQPIVKQQIPYRNDRKKSNGKCKRRFPSGMTNQSR